MGRNLISAAMVTKTSLGMGISIYTGGVTLGKNLIWAAMVIWLSQKKELLIDTRRHTLGENFSMQLLSKGFL